MSLPALEILAAKAGTASATNGIKQLGRTLKAIASNMGDDISALVKTHLLSWIPAHLPYAAMGERMLPCGRRLTALDWRANRLVDALAKMGAAAHKASEETGKLLMSTAAIVIHNAAQLGQVTNNFSQTYLYVYLFIEYMVLT